MFDAVSIAPFVALVIEGSITFGEEVVGGLDELNYSVSVT